MSNFIFTENITVAAAGTDSTIFCTQGIFSVIGVYVPTGFDTGAVTFKMSMDAVESSPGVINASPTMAAVRDDGGNPVTLPAGTAANWYALPAMLQGNFFQMICQTQSAERTIKLLYRSID